ncbi:MAG: hypothetical protein R2834_05430 [Rhodothermales bacterium]
MKKRILAAALISLVVSAGCHSEPPPPLLRLAGDSVWHYVQQPAGARLTFAVNGESEIGGLAYTQVHVTIEDGDEIRDAGHLYVRLTDEGLFWRLSDSAHTLLTPGFFMYPVRPGRAYARDGATYRVERDTTSYAGATVNTLTYEQRVAGKDPLRVTFAPGDGMIALESGAFRFVRERP